MGCGIPEKRPGEFDARGLDHAHPLPGQGPDHTRSIGDDQVSPFDGMAQLRQCAGRHRHLSVEGDDATTTACMKSDGSSLNITANVHGDAENPVPAAVIWSGGD